MIEIDRNNDYRRVFNVKKPDGSPQDLSLVSDGFYTLAASNRSAVAYLQKPFSDPSFTITDAANGVVEILLSNSDTESLPLKVSIYEELHLISTDGVDQTVYKGSVIVTDTIATGV